METEQLQKDIVARWREITADRFWPSPDGERLIRSIRLGYGSKRMPTMDGDDYPFIATKITTGSDQQKESSITVIVVAGLYSPVDADGGYVLDDTSTAESMVAEGVASLRQIGAGCNYFPFSLTGLKWQIGDSDGEHPGPGYYIIAAELTFWRAPMLNTLN